MFHDTGVLTWEGWLIKIWWKELSKTKISSGWWFQKFHIFTPAWGNDPIWLIFFRWVETANQKNILLGLVYVGETSTKNTPEKFVVHVEAKNFYKLASIEDILFQRGETSQVQHKFECPGIFVFFGGIGPTSSKCNSTAIGTHGVTTIGQAHTEEREPELDLILEALAQGPRCGWDGITWHRRVRWISVG